MTDYTRTTINSWMTGQEALPQLTDLKWGIFKSDAGLDTNTPTDEVAYTGYARQTITFDAGKTNDISVTFPNTDVEYTVTHAALIDNTTGKIIAYGPLTASKVIPNGDPCHFSIGEINMNFLVSACP